MSNPIKNNLEPPLKEDEAQQAAAIKKQIRHRLLGAFALLVITFTLWQLGDHPPSYIEKEFPESPTISLIPATESIPIVDTDRSSIEAEEAEETEENHTLSEAVQLEATELEALETTINEDDEENSMIAVETPPLGDVDDVEEDSGLVIQIGAFSQTQRVQSILEKLESQKFKVNLEPTLRNGVKLTRIRVTALRDRAHAEIVRQQLIKIGFHDASIINLK